jgi:hypothetical protein
MSLCLATAAHAQAPVSNVVSASVTPATVPIPRSSDLSPSGAPGLPGIPKGKASLMGGTIRHVDPLRDQITLQFFGGGTARVLFDGRTRIAGDGESFSLRDLKDGQHVYLETVLDGKNIFARSIRVVTHTGSGEGNGQVMSFRPETGELTLNDAMSREPLKLRLTPNSQVVWQGHAIPATELRVGALISVDFVPSGGSAPIVGKISILAEPGSSFAFSGQVVHLDLHTGLLVLLNPQDGKNYQVFLGPAASGRQDNLREGAEVTVKTQFDGSHYAVSSIEVNSMADKLTSK